MEEEPSLEDILALGGTEDDLSLIRGRTKTTNEDITTNEIDEFIQNIGLLPGQMIEEQDEAMERPTQEKQMMKKKLKDKTSSVNKNNSGIKMIQNETKMNFTINGELSTTPTPGGVVEMLMATQKMEKLLLKIEYNEHKKLLVSIDSEMPWFEESVSELTDRIYSQSVLNHLYTTARQVMTTELKLYERVREKRKGRDVQWLKTVVSSGTLNDKMAALTLLVQESPIHTLVTIDHFLNMAMKKSKRESILAIDTFKELWIADLLPEGRKLKSLQQRPLQQLVASTGRGKGSCDFRLLLIWYYEDQLKTKYARFIATLQKLLHDPVAEIREKILGVAFDLMYQKPEQEQLLLKLIVNKMGDPNRRIASKCILLLLKLLNHHVNMKLIVVRNVEALLHRPNLAQKAQYYAICFLNQIVISPTNQSLALKLINVYFSFFKVYTEKGDFDAKILGALLTGVNRALPFLKADIPSLDDHLNSLFKIVHVGPLATGVQSLALLFQVMEGRQAVSARYYRALYQKLMDPQLSLRSAQQAMFLNLLFKSLKSDPEFTRIKGFLKRILQSCSYHLPHFICGCLVLISEVLKLKSELWPFILQAEAEDKEEFYDVVEGELERCSELNEGEGKNEDTNMEKGNVMAERDKYSMVHREPLYCGAEKSCLWELDRLTHHFHPSVQVFAKAISAGNYITYDGDPLNDFTIIRFFDHFIHKNPKQRKGDHGGSIMQPTGNLLNTEVYTLPGSLLELAKMDERKVRTDLLFIHKFMKRDKELHQVRYGEKKKKRRKDSPPSDEEEEHQSVTGEEVDKDFAGELEQLAKTKRQQQYKEEKKKQKKMRDEDSDTGDSSSDEFDYSDMDPSDLEDNILLSSDSEAEGEEEEKGHVKQKKKNDFTKAELEKILLKNLSSDDEELDAKVPAGNRKRERIEESFGTKNKKGRMDPTDMFASADKFAHLLEGKVKGGRFFSKGDVSQKETDWEEMRAFDFHERGIRGRRKGGYRGQGRSHEEKRTGWGKQGRGRFGTGTHSGEGRGGRSSQEKRRFSRPDKRGVSRGRSRPSRGGGRGGSSQGRSRPSRGGGRGTSRGGSRGRGSVKRFGQSRGGRGMRRGFSNRGRK